MKYGFTRKVFNVLLSLCLRGNAYLVGLPPSSRCKSLTRRGSIFSRAYSSKTKEMQDDIFDEIKVIGQELWKGEEIPVLAPAGERSLGKMIEGEAELTDGVTFQDRAEHFRREAFRGCPKSQHSYGLLLWSGFGGVQRDAEASAKFHAAAAYQNHLDGMAVLGGCIRTGTGVGRNIALGVKTIEYCASTGNPTGVNKKAALLESNQDDFGAVALYEDCLKSGRANALMLFNLGWCLVNGQGVDRKDKDRGISLWEDATEKAPDEGSEEAAWYLYEEYKRDNPKQATHWLDLAEELGYYD